MKQLIMDLYMHRSLFRTASGYIGMGSKAMQEGDKVVAIYGSDPPLVLTPRGHHHRTLILSQVYNYTACELLASREAKGEAIELCDIRWRHD